MKALVDRRRRGNGNTTRKPGMRMSQPSWSPEALQKVIEHHWGFHTLRPLQEQAMRAVLDGRDSVVVLPTGGGKSLCYQAPAVLRQDTTVVISPLISLMKDQVDGLQACSVPAIQIDSSQSPEERYHYEQNILQGAVRLLFVSPERLVLTDFYQLLRRIHVRRFAIDEAHCISHWGHDFRPEYRQLNRLKELFPEASVHAYTATATERVRQDIIAQLGLQNAAVLVGNFDRPNLTYRVLGRREPMKQVLEVLDRHRDEAGIIYCLRRRDVDDLAGALQQRGFKVQAYHAGLTNEQRKAAQEAFAAEKCDVVVATVAFGMGIDRSNVRYVLHVAMPKSLEHYQQETGRAGRDGLEAECVLLHSGGDFFTWKSIIEKSGAEPGVDPAFVPGALQHLNDIDHYCRGAVCRHRALVQYFGQAYPVENCGACDICLGDAEAVPDAMVVAQKILSCVARVKERFGVGQVVSVLRGEDTESIRKWGHDKLSTYGLLNEHGKADVRDWIYQLIGQEVLRQEEITTAAGTKAPILRLNPGSWEVMRGQRTVRLMQPVRRKKGERPEKSKADAVSWEGVDRELFEAMRGLRRQLAEERQWQPYMVFSDATLRELARMRPSTLEKMRPVYGVGDTKLRDFGGQFLKVITEHCRQRNLSVDNAALPRIEEPRKPPARANPVRDLAFQLFRQQLVIEDVMHQTQRGRATVADYLAEWIREERPRSISTWVSHETYGRVAAAARQLGTSRLKPIFIALGEQVSYDDIRLVVAHLLTRSVEPNSGASS
jgi:ATP-dependent DNA helicase RecQ